MTLSITYPHHKDDNGRPIQKKVNVRSTTGKQVLPFNAWALYVKRQVTK